MVDLIVSFAFVVGAMSIGFAVLGAVANLVARRGGHPPVTPARPPLPEPQFTANGIQYYADTMDGALDQFMRDAWADRVVAERKAGR